MTTTEYKDIFNKDLIPNNYYIIVVDDHFFNPNDFIVKYLGDVELKGRLYCKYVTLQTILENKQDISKRLYQTVYHTKRINLIPITEDLFNDYLNKVKNG